MTTQTSNITWRPWPPRPTLPEGHDHPDQQHYLKAIRWYSCTRLSRLRQSATLRSEMWGRSSDICWRMYSTALDVGSPTTALATCFIRYLGSPQHKASGPHTTQLAEWFKPQHLIPKWPTAGFGWHLLYSRNIMLHLLYSRNIMLHLLYSRNIMFQWFKRKIIARLVKDNPNIV